MKEATWGEIAQKIKDAFDYEASHDSASMEFSKCVYRQVLDIYENWAQAYGSGFCHSLEDLGVFTKDEMERIDRHVNGRQSSCRKSLSMLVQIFSIKENGDKK